MNSIEELRDYYLSDEIRRIESLTREQLVRELVTIKAERIEALSALEILHYGKGNSN
jgi:hypothetical protein